MMEDFVEGRWDDFKYNPKEHLARDINYRIWIECSVCGIPKLIKNFMINLIKRNNFEVCDRCNLKDVSPFFIEMEKNIKNGKKYKKEIR
tara:strand:+ start:8518 stop:8784 length:267 start_codon:yes stop_codon:yes gene_type:complete